MKRHQGRRKELAKLKRENTERIVTHAKQNKEASKRNYLSSGSKDEIKARKVARLGQVGLEFARAHPRPRGSLPPT